MKFVRTLAVVIAVILFIIPFFWLRPGFVDLGGDSGRLYFVNPLAGLRSTLALQNLTGATFQSLIPYEFFLYLLQLVVKTPTNVINVSNGIKLSLGFYFFYLSGSVILLLTKKAKDKYAYFAAFIGGIIYATFISNSGWAQSLETHNQVFLNPLLFYLLIKFFETASYGYGLALLATTVIFSGNFGYSAMPQILSFYPLATIYLYMLFRYILHRTFPWKRIFILFISFLGLHAFHIIPIASTVIGANNYIHDNIFSGSSIQNSGLFYFDLNHAALGKISAQLFTPSAWNGQSFLIFIIPVIAFAGFLKKSKLLSLTGIFFAITLYLVSANITNTGTAFYRFLFHIPGFLMFRSFNDKWYYVYALFYVLLFIISFFTIVQKWKKWIVVFLSCAIVGILVYRIMPFLRGNALYITLYQSKNVSNVFRMDPDLTSALTFVGELPMNGNFLTVPLTFPYSQVLYGKDGGAYSGISMVSGLAGRKDFPGFWSFGTYKQQAFDALRAKDTTALLRIFSKLGIRYIFYDSDPRVIDNFPGYPFIYPGDMYSSKDQVPLIRDQQGYKTLLSSLPLTKLYEKGFFSVFEISNSPDYQQPNIDPGLKIYFTIGRIISVAVLIVLVGHSIWYFAIKH